MVQSVNLMSIIWKKIRGRNQTKFTRSATSKDSDITLYFECRPYFSSGDLWIIGDHSNDECNLFLCHLVRFGIPVLSVKRFIEATSFKSVLLWLGISLFSYNSYMRLYYNGAKCWRSNQDVSSHGEVCVAFQLHSTNGPVSLLFKTSKLCRYQWAHFQTRHSVFSRTDGSASTSVAKHNRRESWPISWFVVCQATNPWTNTTLVGVLNV